MMSIKNFILEYSAFKIYIDNIKNKNKIEKIIDFLVHKFNYKVYKDKLNCWYVSLFYITEKNVKYYNLERFQLINENEFIENYSKTFNIIKNIEY